MRLLILNGLAVASLSAAALAATWEPIAALPVGKGDAFAVRWNGSLYVVGGPPWQNGGDQDGSVYKYFTSSWGMTAPLNGVGPFVSQGGGVDGLNRIVFFGGYEPSSGDGGPSMVYDPVDGATTAIASRPGSAPKQGFAFAADNLGRLYSLGGGAGAGASNSSFVCRYTASTNSWATLASLPAAASQACAAYDGAGHVYVFGGFNANGSARTADVQRLDIASGTWSNTNTPDMPVALSDASAVLGADHRIYVVGGVNAGGAVQSATYVLDTWSNTWSVGPSMAAARAHAAAVAGGDDWIYVMGGKGPGGTALATAERLYTPPCPTLTQQPVDGAGWEGMSIGFSVAATGGTPLTFQWRRHGQPLADGPMATGGIVTGATTNLLAIQSPTAADIDDYDVVVSTPCGDTASQSVTFTLQSQPAMPRRWTAHLMHPSWASWSRITVIDGATRAGSSWMPFDIWSLIEQPTIWQGTDAASAVNLVPPGSAGGAIAAMDGDTLVGWWWWPYDCYVSGQWYTCYDMQASAWTGGGVQQQNLQVSGWEFSELTAVANGIKGGYVWTDDVGPDTYTFNAGLWLPPNNSFVNVQPPGYWRTFIEAADGNHQYGFAFEDGSTAAHAASWAGSAASFIDLNPPSVLRSLLWGAGGGQQVGTTGYVNAERAGVWAGSAAAFRDLHPAGFAESAAWGCRGGYQVGIVTNQGIDHAVIWTGSPESMLDLHATLPPPYNASYAFAVDVAADGTVTVAGSAWNPALGREEAVLWTSSPAILGDLDGDGHVGGADLAILLGAWGTSDPSADLDHDGTVGGADLALLLGAWTG